MRSVVVIGRAVIAVVVAAILIVPLVCAATRTTSLYVAGGSMRPTFSVGDVVYVRESQRYGVGDIVHLEASQSYVHRIVAVQGDGTFLTCGDALCPDPDDRLAGTVDPEPVRWDEIAGKVVARIGSPWSWVLRQGATWPGRVVGALVCLAALWPWGQGRRREKVGTP